MDISESAINSLRSEMASGFLATNQRIGALENELHRHQAEDRSDMGAMRTDIRTITATHERLTGKIEGSLATLKWVIGIPAFVSASGTLVSLIRHW